MKPTYQSAPGHRHSVRVLGLPRQSHAAACGAGHWYSEAMGRCALADFQLGEFFLPAGTTVLMSQFVTHRDPRFFADPLQFNPEHFTPEEKARRVKFTYFPFGAGVRQCIGESFAWMESILLLATLAQKWKLSLVPGHRVEPEPLITLRPKYGMKMMIEER